MRGWKVLVALLLSFSAVQSASAGNIEWKYNVVVQRLQPNGDSGFIMYMPSGTWAACQEGGTVFRVVPGQGNQTSEGVKNTLAMVMMAFAMSKTINFAFDDAACTVNAVVVNR